MRAFTDSAGRTWTLSMTIDAAKRVRGLLDVDLLQPEAGSPPLLARLGTDVILLCDVVFALVKPQADAAGVSDEQFGAALGGQAILAAQAAFYEELIDFFRQAGRAHQAKALQSQRSMIAIAIENITAEIEALDLKGLVTIDAREPAGRTDGGSSTSSPASSAATPDG